ncbi:MAG TPA: alkaline phosphatase family protein, partial [Candidatus Synoicihabitans sp.]|nr:alkaline phosphatase family protein [Candidatus Synoicihabitans sp.]
MTAAADAWIVRNRRTNTTRSGGSAFGAWLVALALGLGVTTARAGGEATPPPRLALLIVVDQMRGDYLERFAPWFVDGGFRRMMKDGATFIDAHHRHALTATAPGHATVAVGASADVHGVIANDWFDFAGGRFSGAVEDAAAPLVGAGASFLVRPGGLPAPDSTASPRRLLAATLGDQLKLRFGARARVIGLGNKDRAAILLSGRLADSAYWIHGNRIVTSRYYREALPSWLEAYNATQPLDRWFGHSWDRLLETSVYDAVQGPDDAAGEEIRHGLGGRFPRRIDGGADEIGPEFYNAFRLDPASSVLVGELAQQTIRGESLGQDDVPDLLTIGFSQLDHAGHSYGPDSHEVMDSVLRLDRVLAELLTFLDHVVGVDRYVVALTADHGVAPLPE